MTVMVRPVLGKAHTFVHRNQVGAGGSVGAHPRSLDFAKDEPTRNPRCQRATSQEPSRNGTLVQARSARRQAR